MPVFGFNRLPSSDERPPNRNGVLDPDQWIRTTSLRPFRLSLGFHYQTRLVLKSDPFVMSDRIAQSPL
ncbi:hypothetical protein N7519_005569 [Penicillium mononematosum]|uniref:uncharacterized protein n=1 Tax=Penicillium mononematosum TaxID=268346 RepID=UPI0025476DAD|nr:uncharacterized protein N7519_005569 [Penicillium mononematosum]KAJ6184268.1 hypothetical protein N7519_005569 [Penicillium mononematosum]